MTPRERQRVKTDIQSKSYLRMKQKLLEDGAIKDIKAGSSKSRNNGIGAESKHN